MESNVDFDLLGYRWRVKPESAEILKKEVIPLAFSEEESPRKRVIKRKLARDTLIVSFDNSLPDVFVKIHKYDKPKERLKSLFVSSRAQAEWAIGQEMLACGLPVAEPLGFGECRSGRGVDGCVVLQRALPPSIRLSEYLSYEESRSMLDDKLSAPEGAKIGDLLISCGRLIQQMHSAGFQHRDLHSGNILIETESSPGNMWIVDLHSAKRSADVSNRGRKADLAKLVFTLRDAVETADLQKMLEAYDPHAGQTQVQEMLLKLNVKADSLRKQRIRSRSKRCLKTSGGFVVERSGNRKIYRRRDLEKASVLDAVNRHIEARNAKSPELFKVAPKSVVTAFLLPGGAGEKIFVKEFANQGLIRRLETALYVHRGRRAWKAGHRLKWLGIPSAELLALVEERNLGLISQSYLLMKEIPSASRLNIYLLDNYFRVKGRLTRSEILKKRELIRAGAASLKEFHSNQIYHKDMSTKNLLVGSVANGEIRFYCIDLDSVQFPWWTPSLRRRIKNLAQLNGAPGCITKADKIRFYKEYFGLQSLTPKHKMIIRYISRISWKRMRGFRRMDTYLKTLSPFEKSSYENIETL